MILTALIMLAMIGLFVLGYKLGGYFSYDQGFLDGWFKRAELNSIEPAQLDYYDLTPSPPSRRDAEDDFGRSIQHLPERERIKRWTHYYRNRSKR